MEEVSLRWKYLQQAYPPYTSKHSALVEDVKFPLTKKREKRIDRQSKITVSRNISLTGRSLSKAHDSNGIPQEAIAGNRHFLVVYSREFEWFPT